MLLLCLGTGVGVTDCHSQCTHWLRNDRGSCMGCGGAGDRKGRPYGGHGSAVGRRATARVAPTGGHGGAVGRRATARVAHTEGTVVRWDGGRPQGSPLRGRMHSVKMPRRVCRPQAAKLCARQTGGLLAEKSEIFRQGRQKSCPGVGQPL